VHYLPHPPNPLYAHSFPYNVTCKCQELLIFNININEVIKILESQEDTKLNKGGLNLKILLFAFAKYSNLRNEFYKQLCDIEAKVGGLNLVSQELEENDRKNCQECVDNINRRELKTVKHRKKTWCEQFYWRPKI
jgi:hypothetical protein